MLEAACLNAAIGVRVGGVSTHVKDPCAYTQGRTIEANWKPEQRKRGRHR